MRFDKAKSRSGLQPSYYKIRAIGKVIPADVHWLDVMKNELYPDGNADVSSTFKLRSNKGAVLNIES